MSESFSFICCLSIWRFAQFLLADFRILSRGVKPNARCPESRCCNENSELGNSLRVRSWCPLFLVCELCFHIGFVVRVGKAVGVTVRRVSVAKRLCVYQPHLPESCDFGFCWDLNSLAHRRSPFPIASALA